MPLTMSHSMSSGDGPPTKENTVQYMVRGFANHNKSALIGQTPNTRPVRWQTRLQIVPDVQGDWHGDYATPEEALAALSEDTPGATLFERRHANGWIATAEARVDGSFTASAREFRAVAAQWVTQGIAALATAQQAADARVPEHDCHCAGWVRKDPPVA